MPLYDINRLTKLLPVAERYRTAEPFPHRIIDDFADPAVLDRCLELLPAESNREWRLFQNGKRSFNNMKSLPSLVQDVFRELNSPEFVGWLRAMTGVDDLTPDKTFGGAGIHVTPRKGKLDVHVDYNMHPDGRYRRVNCFLFLNRNWEEDWGGELELWDMQKRDCVRRIVPRFNRFVMFGSTETSYHGHPKPLNCPPDRRRISFACYYFSRSQPPDFKEKHSTLYVRTG